MTTVFHAWPYGRFIEIQSNLRRKKLHRTNQGSNFLGGSFSNRDNIRAPIQFGEESQPSILNIVFPQEQIHPSSNQQHQCYQTSPKNGLSFSNIENNKALPAQIHSVLQIRFKFRSQFQLLPQIRYLITFRVESSIISIDSNITYNIIRTVIRTKCKTNNREIITLTGCSCEDFPSRTARSHPLLRKKK